jgi:hypothetical protein
MQLSPQALPWTQIRQQPEGAAVWLVLELPAPELPGAELEPPPVPGANVVLGVALSS